MLKVIAFDLFGTVFNLSNTPRQEIKDYAHHLRQSIWSPLFLPDSWLMLPTFPDSRVGIERLRKHYTVVTCSNAPTWFTIRLLKNAGIEVDGICPLEMDKVYKPKLEAYKVITKITNCLPSEVMMVTANKDFGDLEGSALCGMQAQLIRYEGHPKTIIELADKLK